MAPVALFSQSLVDRQGTTWLTQWFATKTDAITAVVNLPEGYDGRFIERDTFGFRVLGWRA